MPLTNRLRCEQKMAGFQVAVGSRSIDGHHFLSGRLEGGSNEGCNQLAVKESLREIYVGPPISQQVIDYHAISRLVEKY